ncbi:MAG: M48 family metallopeptidase, partial [Terracidiphilus sp.]
MKIAPRWLPILGFTAVLSFFAPGISGQQAPSQPASPAIVQQDAATPQATTQAYTLPPEKLAKAIALNRIRNILDIVTGLWGIAFLWLLLATRAAAGIESWVGKISTHRWLQGLIFFAIFFILLALANLPLDIYGHHLSTSYGISVQGWGSWFGDQAKALALTILFGAPVLLLFNWIVGRWPRRYWFGIWLITLPLILISIFVAPLLEPLFNKYEPLSKHHAALVDKLETVVARTGTNIPPDRMFLMFASLKTNGLNAYVNGIGATKRIVVWDTTAGRIPDDEVMFVFGHESGHYVLNHIPKQLAGMAAALFFVYWACAGLAAWLARRHGASWHLQPSTNLGATDLGAPSFRGPIAEGWETTNPNPVNAQSFASSATSENPLSTRAGFLLLIFMFFVAMFVLEPIGNTFSRHFEHEADIYGQEA